MSTALQAAVDELRTERDRYAAKIIEHDEALEVLEQLLVGVAPVKNRGPAPASKAKAKPVTAGRDAKGKVITCSERGCDKTLRSDNSSGMCKRHANAAAARERRAAASAKPRKAKAAGDVSQSQQKRWRAELLKPVLQHAPGTPERAEATAALIGTTVDGPDGKPITMGKTKIYMWLKQAG